MRHDQVALKAASHTMFRRLGFTPGPDSIGPIIDAYLESAQAETQWICHYPEFNDETCMVKHDPAAATAQAHPMRLLHGVPGK